MTAGRQTAARFALLGSLYFAQGMPYGFFTQALPTILREQGVALGKIGLLALLTAPWALKFSWAPIVERRWWPAIGRRRSWLLPMQLAGTLILLALAIVPSFTRIEVWLAATVALNLIAATQDIATDGLAVDILPVGERGFANGLQVAGYRLGMVISGGLLLGLYAHLGPRGVFATMAVLTALASVPVILAREPRAALPAPTQPLVHFLRRPGAWRLLALIALYKAGEVFATGMLRPFLVDHKLTLTDVGWMVGTVGSIAGMLGALTGGALVARLGRARALSGFGVVQVLAVGGYAYLALTVPSVYELYVWCGVEHFASGMATAALFTCMMDWCAPESAATDYAVQACTVVIATGIASTVSGFSAQAFGYGAHFLLAALVCAAAVVASVRLFPSGALPTARALPRG